MNFLLVSSNADKASSNFKEVILSKFKNNLKMVKKDLYLLDVESINKIYLKIIDKLHIFSEEKDVLDDLQKENIGIDQVIFLSKHATLTENKPSSLTVHAVGNWGKADMGGKDGVVVETDPILIRTLLINLKESKSSVPSLKSFEVKQEATHHGPFLNVSTIFYEIGSSEIDWVNRDAAEFMFKVLIDTILIYDREKIKKENSWEEAVGYGGSHYCTKFNKKTFDKNYPYTFGHVVASYGIAIVKEQPELLEQAKKKSNSEIVIREEDLN